MVLSGETAKNHAIFQENRGSMAATGPPVGRIDNVQTGPRHEWQPKAGTEKLLRRPAASSERPDERRTGARLTEKAAL